MELSEILENQYSLYELVDVSISECLYFMNTWFAEKHVKSMLGNIHFEVDEKMRKFSLAYNGLTYKNIGYPYVQISDYSQILYRDSDKDIEFFRDNRLLLEICISEGKLERLVNDIRIENKRVKTHFDKVLSMTQKLVDRYEFTNQSVKPCRAEKIRNLKATIKELRNVIDYFKNKQECADSINEELECKIEDAKAILGLILKWLLYIENRMVVIVPQGKFIAPLEKYVKGYTIKQLYSASAIKIFREGIYETMLSRSDPKQFELNFKLAMGHQLFHSIHYLLCKCNCQEGAELWNSYDDKACTVRETLATIFELAWYKKLENERRDAIRMAYLNKNFDDKIYPAYPMAGAAAFVDYKYDIKYSKVAELMEESFWSWESAYDFIDSMSDSITKKCAQPCNWYRKIRSLKYDLGCIDLENIEDLPVKELEFEIRDNPNSALEIVLHDKQRDTYKRITNSKIIYNTLLSLKRSLIINTRNKHKNKFAKSCVQDVSDLFAQWHRSKTFVLDAEYLMPMDRTFLWELGKYVC